MRREVERPYWLRVLIALGKAAAYLALFLGWQMAVGVAYSTSLTTELMLANPTLDYYALYDLVYDAYLAKTMEISLISGLLTLVSVVLFFKVRRRSLRQELWLRPVRGRLLGWCAALAFCLYWLVTIVLSMLPEAWLEDYLAAAEGLDQTGVIAFLAAAIVAPIVEEVIFRGLILTRLNRVMSGWLAVAVAAAIFGLCHGQFIWFCYAFVLGLIFGYITRSTVSILPAMLMHLVFNATNELMMLAGEWEPGVIGWLVIFAVAIVGTAFCALRVRSTISSMPVPFVRSERPAQIEENAVIIEAPPLEEHPHPGQRPAAAMWDADSGPNHRFPPNRM